MRALENPMAAETLIREADEFLRSLHPRAEGLHVSDLVRCRRQGWYTRNGFTLAPHSTQTLLLFLMGQGHHSLLEAGMEEVSLEIDLDGIKVTGSVDHMEEDNEGEYPAEFKTTRASSKRMIVPSDHYIEQAASYAVMKGTNHARIYVIFLLGDYARTKLPTIKAWDLVFTDQEVDAWRNEMARRARVLVGDTVPSLAEHAEWECKYCPLSQRVGGPCEGGGGSTHQWFPSQQDVGALVVRGNEDE
jgi:CRISPR/Cas system-associated exonuclease Cas4 (RecB family)